MSLIKYFCLVLFVVVSKVTYCVALFEYKVIDFLKDSKRLHGVDTVLLAVNGNVTEMESSFLTFESDKNITEIYAFVKDIMDDLQVPVVQMDESSPVLYLKRTYKDTIMAVVYFDGVMDDHSGLLAKLLLNLRHMTLAKVLFLINRPMEDFALLEQLFMWCWRNNFLNVVALFSDYQVSEQFYSYSNFPEFEIEVKKIYMDLFNRKDIYPYRLKDLRGFKLSYIIGGSDPRIIVYRDKNGQVIVGGFVGRFLRTYAEKVNCTLYEPLPSKMNQFAPSQDLIAAVRNGTVEISAGITFPTIPFIGYSYPYEQMNWCIALPVPADVPDYEFYTAVFEGSAFLITLALMVAISMILSTALYFYNFRPSLIDFIMHENSFRGVLGQSFMEIAHPPKLVRFIYLQICVLGILMTTTYNAYFSTYVTSAPKMPELRTFDDILASGLKLYTLLPEYNELIGRVKEFAKYEPMFYRESNYQEYLKTRDSLNTMYGYVLPTTKWTIVNEQQKIFTNALFNRREDLCFFNNIPMCFPIHENSMFKESLYEMMLRIAESGLTSHWRLSGFTELIMAGKMSFADLSEKKEFKAMQIEALIYVWQAYGAMVALTTIVFCGELVVHYRYKLIGCFKRLGCRRN